MDSQDVARPIGKREKKNKHIAEMTPKEEREKNGSGIELVKILHQRGLLAPCGRKLFETQDYRREENSW